MTLRLWRTLQALVLAGLGLFMLQKVWSGTLNWYLSDRFLPLILAAAVGCLALAGAVLPPWRSTREADRLRGEPPEGRQKASAWRLLLVALPVLVGVLVPAHPLEWEALASRGINPAALLAGMGNAAGARRPERGAATILDWVQALNSAADPRALSGQRADVIGFVHHDPSLPAGEFMVARFTAYCCAAEAAGVALRVQWPQAAALEAGTWVRVVGPVQPGLYAGRPIAVIVAESVAGVEEPARPYLYP